MNPDYKKIIESHFSDQDLMEIRNRGGSNLNYVDLLIPSHYQKFHSSQNKDYDIMDLN